MGQHLSCLQCRGCNTMVVPLATIPNAMKFSQSTLLFKNASFHRPDPMHLTVRSSVENLSAEFSKRTSLATISLGSVQTLSSDKSESDSETMNGAAQDNSPSNCRHPGLQTPEPEDVVLDSCQSKHSMANQEASSSVRSRIGGRQSRVGTSSTYPRLSTPRPREPRLIMVKPYQGCSANISEEPEPERMCKHGKPLTGEHGDPHEVNCVKCERPTSRGGRVLAGMMAFRRADTRKRKEEKRLKKKKLAEEQEKRKKTSEAQDDALRQFAERQ